MRHIKKRQRNHFFFSVLFILLGVSAFFVAANQLFNPDTSVHGQLYGTHNCSYNVGCCSPPNDEKTQVLYLTCPLSIPCSDANPDDCDADNGYGCSYIAGSDCSVAGCHPTYCWGVCGLGGCPGGCGSQDDCGGVSCGSCGSPSCGDGSCDGSETCSSCASDCGSCSGGGSCGDGSCTGSETCTSCSSDCGACSGASCGNGTCEASEDSSSCPADCPTNCGNIVCELGEDSSSCPVDCPVSCGNGSCDGSETTLTCPTDCGPGFCGNTVCEAAESIGSCAVDCCDTGTSTIRVRGVVVPASDTSRSAAESSTTYIDIDVTLSPSCELAALTASSGSYATFTDYPDGTYTITASAPAGYILQAAYWDSDVPGAQGTGLTADIENNGTLTWHLAYTAGTPWVQAQGGDVYAANNISSPVAAGASSQFFMTDGASGSPGVVTYGASYDFDSAAGVQGEAYVSSDGWLANDTFPATDYYSVMYQRFGSPDATSTGNTTYTSERPSGTYFVDGNLTISTADWNVTSGESIVVFVDGDLTINRKINLSGTGFVSFIVNGDITIASTVGVTYSSATPVIEGMYITSPSGTISTSASTTVGSERFVGEGIFVTGDFILPRDLDSVSQNNSTAAELFIYNPQLLVSMPEAMKDVPVSWQEVAP